MKKLMVMVAAAALAGVASAATWQWSAGSGRLFDGAGTDMANRYVGVGYMIDAATISQADLLAAFYDTTTTVDAKYLEGKAESFADFENGRSDGGEYTRGTHDLYTAYFAALSADGKGLYISDAPEMTPAAGGIGASLAEFGNQNDYSSTFKDAGAAYAGAGWYTAAVPEPTSGLLLLLGVAGLALRRRRA